MAKEIPFFKFYVGEWANGDITAESFELQGVFINICSIYWAKEGKITKRFINKKFGENYINELIEANILKIENDEIFISFLDEQLEECKGIRRQASNAGKASAAARARKKSSTGVQQAFNDNSTGVQRSLSFRSTEVQPIREDKNKNKNKNDIREDKNKNKSKLSAEAESDFLRFWDLYAKKTGKEKCLSIFKRLKKSEVEEIFEALPAYIAATPEIKYRKNPQTWLNGKHWRDEVDFTTDLTKTKNFEQPKFYEDEL